MAVFRNEITHFFRDQPLLKTVVQLCVEHQKNSSRFTVLWAAGVTSRWETEVSGRFWTRKQPIWQLVLVVPVQAVILTDRRANSLYYHALKNYP